MDFAHVEFKSNVIKCLRGHSLQQFCPSPTEEINMNAEGMRKS